MTTRETHNFYIFRLFQDGYAQEGLCCRACQVDDIFTANGRLVNKYVEPFIWQNGDREAVAMLIAALMGEAL